MSKTIKELASELGVSKTYISQTINANSWRNDLQKIGNKFVISEELEILIKQAISSKSQTESKTENRKQSQTENDRTDDNSSINLEKLYSQIEFLQLQLTEKDNQIKEKDKQLDQQQQLTLKALQTQEQLQIELTNKNQEIESLIKQTSKKWYQFWK